MNLMENNSGLIKRPPRLVPGDTIGIAAPASTFNNTVFEKGLSVLQKSGFKILVPDEIFQRKGYLAGPDTQRADILMRLLTNGDINGVMCARGGYGTMKLLPLLNFDSLVLMPKVFIGFSDITALLVNLVEKSHWVVFHGPTVGSLSDADSASFEALQQAVSANIPITLCASRGTAIFPGTATGPLMAGNLTTLCHLIGTPFMPNFRGDILLIEDRGEALYRIDRMLTQMKMAGCFDHLAGLALGHFTECGDIVDIENIIRGLFQDCKIPILSGFEVGHDPKNLTLPLGLNATLDTWNQTLRLHSPATSESRN